MGQADGNCSNSFERFTTGQESNSLNSIADWNIDMTNPLDSALSSHLGSATAGDNGQQHNQLFGTLTLEFGLSPRSLMGNLGNPLSRNGSDAAGDPEFKLPGLSLVEGTRGGPERRDGRERELTRFADNPGQIVIQECAREHADGFGKTTELRVDREMIEKVAQVLTQMLTAVHFLMQDRSPLPRPPMPSIGGSGDAGFDRGKSNGSDNGKKNGNDKRDDSDNRDSGDEVPPVDATLPERDGKVVHVENGEQLENLKIEPNMQVKLAPGVTFKIEKGLTLPQGASIVGDSKNPPTIDYVGSSDGFPNIINVHGKNATIDGVNFESSKLKAASKGGASGIRASEAADNLQIRNCTAGRIATFMHIDGADNVTIDRCQADEVNSYFVWNGKGSDNTTIKNSRCNDSRLEWVVRSYGDNLRIENSHIENKNLSTDPNKGALAIYDGKNARVTDSTISGGMRLGPLTGPIHGAQYVDSSDNSKLKPGLSERERDIAMDKLSAVVDGVFVEGNTIEGWLQFSQNSKNVRVENNDIIGSGSNGPYATFTAFDGRYKGFRSSAEGVLINNRFSGDNVKSALSNPSGSNVRLGEGNTLHGKPI